MVMFLAFGLSAALGMVAAEQGPRSVAGVRELARGFIASTDAFEAVARLYITVHSSQASGPHPRRVMSGLPTPDRSPTDTEFRYLAHGETCTFTTDN
jgi:actin-like ATPase involved in cell morphogenesis